MAWRGWVGRGLAGPGKEWQAWLGLAWRGEARTGEAGKARQVQEGPGMAGWVRLGEAWRGGPRKGRQGTAWRGGEGHGEEWQAWRGVAGPGWARPGMARSRHRSTRVCACYILHTLTGTAPHYHTPVQRHTLAKC